MHKHTHAIRLLIFPRMHKRTAGGPQKVGLSWGLTGEVLRKIAGAIISDAVSVEQERLQHVVAFKGLAKRCCTVLANAVLAQVR